MTMVHKYGVRIAGTGSAVPSRILTNACLEKIIDTSDEWIVQRTGIHERRIVDQDKEGTFTLSCDALNNALDDASISPSELDLVIVATVTGEMTCPAVSARVVSTIGAIPAGAFDLLAACCGFVYSINVADAIVRSGRYKTVGVVGCDAMSTAVDYKDRSVSILFGDCAGAVILTRDDDPEIGCLYQNMHSDGAHWESLYIPRREQEIPDCDKDNPNVLGTLRMKGREIYKFAVSKMRLMIEEALEATGLDADQISQFICHQSNLRIIESARDKLGLPHEKVYINIDKYGNSSAGSVGLCFDEICRAGKVKPGDYVMFIAIGGGLTWTTSVWKV